MLIQAPKGTIDILPGEVARWQALEKLLREVSHQYTFHEIRTPAFEHTELFARGVGDTTDVVSKEMYTFMDKGGRSVTLRPEGTAGLVRSFLEHGLYGDAQPTKLYYIIPCYRYEKPQAGRLREFRQYGVELYGSYSPSADCEVISIAWDIFERLGIHNLTLLLNNIGCPQCRKEYHQKLLAYLTEKEESLCATCHERMEKNPMRIFDCKSEICQSTVADAPKIFDHVCEDCKNHFDQTLSYLDQTGIPYQIDKKIVRGLDYYTRTVFEFVSNEIGAQGTVCAGGRYDNLIEELGGKPCPGIGFAMGMERLLMVLQKTGTLPMPDDRVILYAAGLGEEGELYAAGLISALRKKGVKCEKDHLGRSLKAQMKYANKIHAEYSVVIGSQEIEENRFELKNMDTGEIITLTREEILNDWANKKGMGTANGR